MELNRYHSANDLHSGLTAQSDITWKVTVHSIQPAHNNQRSHSINSFIMCAWIAIDFTRTLLFTSHTSDWFRWDIMPFHRQCPVAYFSHSPVVSTVPVLELFGTRFRVHFVCAEMYFQHIIDEYLVILKLNLWHVPCKFGANCCLQFS